MCAPRSFAATSLIALWMALAWLSVCPGVASQPGPSPARPARADRFISQVGRSVVARSDIGVFGTVARVTRFHGTTIGRLRVERVLHGNASRPGGELIVMAGDPKYFGAVGDRIVVFAVKHGRTQFRALSRITLDSTSGRRRVEILEKVIEIETRPGASFARALALKDLFFRLLVDRIPDIRMLAVRELLSLSEIRADVFLRRDLDRIDQLDLMRKLPPTMRAQLKRLVDRLRRLPDRNEDRIRFHRRALESAVSEQATIDVLLRAVGELNRDALSILVQALGDRFPRVREMAATRLGRIGDPVAVPSLMRQLREEPVAAVQAGILDALGHLRATSAVPALVAAVPRPELRREAILALARVGSPDALASLRRYRDEFASPGEGADAAAVKLIDFVFSPRFKEQEAKLERLRKRSP